MTDVRAIMARYSDDLFALGAKSVEAMPDGVGVTFANDSQQRRVMGLIRDEVDGVKLIPTHEQNTYDRSDIFARDTINLLAGGHTRNGQFPGLPGVQDVAISHSARGVQQLTITSASAEHAGHLSKLMRTSTDIQVAIPDPYANMDGPAVAMPMTQAGPPPVPTSIRIV